MLDIDKSDTLVYDTKTNRLYEANLEKDPDEFCLYDEKTNEPIFLTKEEKERIFLDSIQSYYFSGKNKLPDDQFDKLKEELTWEGSPLATLNRNETLFINAITSYNRGKPILSDPQFDELKKSLRDSNSRIAVSTEPVCYVDTGICKVTWQPDRLRIGSLYFPAQLMLSLIWIGAVFEIPFLDINPILSLIIGTAPVTWAAKRLTEEVIFKEPFIASGACPSCGAENRVFFGDVLGVEGDKEEATVKCTNCKTGMTVKRSTLRVSTLFSKKGPPTVGVVLED